MIENSPTVEDKWWLERQLYGDDDEDDEDEEEGWWVKFGGLQLISCPLTEPGPHEATTVTMNVPCLKASSLSFSFFTLCLPCLFPLWWSDLVSDLHLLQPPRSFPPPSLSLTRSLLWHCCTQSPAESRHRGLFHLPPNILWSNVFLSVSSERGDAPLQSRLTKETKHLKIQNTHRGIFDKSPDQCPNS